MDLNFSFFYFLLKRQLSFDIDFWFFELLFFLLNERAEFYRFVYAGGRVKATIGDLEFETGLVSKIYS